MLTIMTMNVFLTLFAFDLSGQKTNGFSILSEDETENVKSGMFEMH